ncbi:MAG: RNA-binding protein [bacterium]|nr:RNA-binding protein [bacterium]
MAKRLFVGSLPYTVTDQQLAEIFSAAGTVESANVIMDKFSGRSKGFGFVEMSSDEEATKAVSELNGKEVDGRAIVVNEARPREERPSR